jgi:hypothetical protein
MNCPFWNPSTPASRCRRRWSPTRPRAPMRWSTLRASPPPSPARPSRRGGLHLHAARAAGRLPRHRRLELSDADHLLEIRPGAGLRQRGRLQAIGDDAAFGAADRCDPDRGGAAGGADQRPAGLLAIWGRSWCPTRASPRSRSPGRSPPAARSTPPRPRGCGTHDGTGRQVAADRLRGCRSGQRGRRRDAGQLLFLGPGLLERHAGLRAARAEGALPRPAEGADRGDPPGRPAGRGTRRWARW